MLALDFYGWILDIMVGEVNKIISYLSHIFIFHTVTASEINILVMNIFLDVPKIFN
jgi:hypothetical protein